MNSQRIAAILFAIGIVCIVIFQMTEPVVDENGVLNEPFALLPLGLGAIFGAIVIVVLPMITAARKNK